MVGVTAVLIVQYQCGQESVGEESEEECEEECEEEIRGLSPLAATASLEL